MPFCWCGWSSDDQTITVCPNAAAHPTPSVSRHIEARRDLGRLNVLAGGFKAEGLRGPVRHPLSDKFDVYQTADGRYVTADGRPVRRPKRSVR